MSYVEPHEDYSEHPQGTVARLKKPWAHNDLAMYHVGFGWKPHHLIPASYGYDTADLEVRFGIEKLEVPA